MHAQFRVVGRFVRIRGLVVSFGLAAVAASACGSGDAAIEPTAARSPITVRITMTEPPAPTVTPASAPASLDDTPRVTGPTQAITVDGDRSDWAAIERIVVPLEQVRIGGLSPSDAEDMDFDVLSPVNVSLRVAADDVNFYLLMEVPDDFDYVPEDLSRSAAVAFQFRIDEPAAVHMGSTEADLDESQGVVDMWHWELGCGPGELSGGQGLAGGDDPACSLDDEYATTPEDREDDGRGDADNPNAENSLAGVWEHTHREGGEGSSGTWIFELSRPLQTGDPQDVQFVRGGSTRLALAYWDPDESITGWSDVGHLTSSYEGWIEVILP